MKLSIASVLTFVAAVVATGDCPANNCNRAVTGTRRGPDHLITASADCSSYMIATATPSATTVTVTTAVCKKCYPGGGHGGGPGGDDCDDDDDGWKGKKPHRRTDTDTDTEPPSGGDVPDYAKACDEPGEYSTACICLGVTPTTTYLPAPTETVTETKTCCKNHYGFCNWSCMK